jgi:hypothetical protein
MEQFHNDDERRLAVIITGVVESIAEVILARMAMRLESSPPAAGTQAAGDGLHYRATTH